MTLHPTVNITPAERIGRVVIGALAAIVGVALLLDATAAAAVVLETLLILTGIDLVVTGSLGHCPLYAKLGHVPTPSRGRVS